SRTMTVFGVIAVLSAGPCYAQETDPHKVTTRDLLFGQSRLDAHLDSRREYLETLNTRLEQLDEQLLQSQAELFSVRRELEMASRTSKELEALLEEITSLEQEAGDLGRALFAAQESMQDLEVLIGQQNMTNEELEAERVAAKNRVEDLEQRLGLMESGIASSLRIRAAQILTET